MEEDTCTRNQHSCPFLWDLCWNFPQRFACDRNWGNYFEHRPAPTAPEYRWPTRWRQRLAPEEASLPKVCFSLPIYFCKLIISTAFLSNVGGLRFKGFYNDIFIHWQAAASSAAFCAGIPKVCIPNCSRKCTDQIHSPVTPMGSCGVSTANVNISGIP